MSSGVMGAGVTGSGNQTETLACTLICFSLACGHALGQVRQDAEVPLEVGQSLSRSLNAGESVTYTLESSGNENYVIEVEQKDLDVVVTLEAPDGTREVYDSPLKQDERELALVEHALPGLYRIAVQSRAPADSAGEHTVRVRSLMNGSQAASELEALRQMTDAVLHYQRGQAGDANQVPEPYAAAAMAYEQAAEQWARLGRSRDNAHALYGAAMVKYLFNWDWYGASRLAAEAALAYEDSELPSLRANALLLNAMALTEAIHETSEKDALLQRIVVLLDESYAIHERLGNTAQLARVRYFNGLSNLNAGRHEQAKEFYVQAAALFATVDDWPGERKVLLDRAVIDINLGNNLDAIEALEELLALNASKRQYQTPEQINFAGTVADQLGSAYAAAQNIDAALRAFSSARDIHRQTGDLHGEAESLRGIANVYLESGDLRLGRDFLSQAEVAARESNNGRILAQVQTALGHLAYSEADYELAKTFYSRALASAPDEGVLLADRQVLLAKACVALGQYDEARELALQAIQAAQTAQSQLTEADALRELGKAYLGLTDRTRSISTLEQSIARYEQLDVADGLADAAHALALALADSASSQPDPAQRVVKLEEALDWSAQSLSKAEGLLRNVVAPELRSYYAATHRQYYQTRINLLMQRYETSREADERFVAEALATSERARARMTIDLLNEASVDLRQSVDPQMAAEIGRLLDDLARVAEEKESVLDRAGADETTRTLITDLSNRAALIENRIDILQAELRRDSTHYAALTAPSTLSLPEIQDLIDDRSVLLHYFLGDEKSFVWIVANDSIQAVQIADRATIDRATERALSSLRSTPAYEPAANAEEKEALATLAELILEPFVELIGDKRLIIVADGALTYLPFQVLPFSRNGAVERLQESREIVALPSTSVLAALRNRERAKPPTKWLAAFADPVFEKTDPRLAGIAGTDDPRSASTADLDRLFLTRSSLAGHLSRLPYTLQEANAIAALVPDEAVSDTDPLIAVGFEASRDKVLGQGLRDYRILHFATHGKVDAEIPALSALVLSRFNERGEAQDGYLRLDDIFSLELNADLVVLSACETGLGTAILGEGLVGLTQGFLYAGARSLLVSLWDVPDRATAELMTRFYGQILNHGLSPAAALRSAQRSMSSDRRWSDPYYWGAFILSGDWQ